jgi:hypothetical protein
VLAQDLEIDDYTRYLGLATLRSKFYITIKSSSIQRWAAKSMASDNYYVLTSTIWRAAHKSAKTPRPAGSVTLLGQRHTYYFDREEDAEAAAYVFLSKLQNERGVKL